MSDDKKPDEVVECWFCENPAGPSNIWLKWFFGKRIPICAECRTQSEMFVQMIGESIRRRGQGR